jgi:hypothetical protein
VCVVVQRDDERGMAVKGNNSDGSSSGGVVLWLVKRQNGDTVDWWGE